MCVDTLSFSKRQGQITISQGFFPQITICYVLVEPLPSGLESLSGYVGSEPSTSGQDLVRNFCFPHETTTPLHQLIHFISLNVSSIDNRPYHGPA